MPKEYSERFLQDKVIELFKNMGYEYLSPEEALFERGGDNGNILLKNILEKQMNSFNYFTYDCKKYSFSEENIKQAINDLDVPLTGGYLTANEKITEKLLNGEGYKEKVGNKRESFNIYYIDFNNIENNVFHITEEFEVKRHNIEEKEKTRRPDLVVFVNGIPLGIIELKKASVSIDEAIEQMIGNQNEGEIRQLFKFSQLLLCANDETIKYATAGTSKKFYSLWNNKEDDRKIKNTLNNIITDRKIDEIDITIYSMFEKERFLDILEYFIIFDNNDKKSKKVARYNQYFAIKKTIKRINNIKDGKREGGVIWHTQGSGKSLTMSILTKIISRKIPNAKIIVVTDRIDLDKQIHGTFQNTSISVNEAKSGKSLISLIKNNKTVITTVINKFEKVFEEKIKIDSRDIFILVDESHRTQYGNLAYKMRKVFPNACYIGFTGTPLYKTEKNTAKKFGGFIDCYTIRDGLKDKVIVPLYYESRLIKLKILDEESLDERHELITRDFTEEQKSDLQNKRVNKNTINRSEQRLIKLADNIFNHYEKNLKDTLFNAMLAVSSKYQALKMKEIFDENYHDLKTEVVISSESSECEEDKINENKKYVSKKLKELYGEYNDYVKYTDNIIKNFKNGEEDNKIDILIVVDKLLTGFDVPRAQVLYMDKELKDHALLQAIARVNRPYEGKDCGILIDYRGLLKNLDLALNKYDKLANYDSEDIEDAIFNLKEKIKEFEKSYKKLIEFLPELESNRTDKLSLCRDLLSEKEKRDKFYDLFSKYSKLLNICQFSEYFLESFNENEIKSYKELFKLCIELRKSLRLKHYEAIDFNEYESKMQKLYDTFIGTEIKVDVLNKIPNILSQDFEKEIEFLEDDEAKAYAILNAANCLIKEKMEENPAFYEKLSEKIKRIIKDYENNRITKEKFLKDSINIKKESGGENYEENIKYDEKIRDNKCARSVYDNTEKYIKEKETLIEFSLFVDNLFKSKSKKPDWQNISTIINDIKGEIDDKLGDLENESKIEKLDDISIRNFIDRLIKIGLKIYSNG